MKKILSISLILVILITISISLKQDKGTPTLNINDREIELIVSNTEELRTKGLSGRTDLNGAMLFVFNTPSKYGFWMKDMNFPIDIVWLDSEKTVVHIENNVLPESYPKVFFPPLDSLYVLEFNSGFAIENNLTVGKKIEFTLE